MRVAIVNPGPFYGGIEKWVLRAAQAMFDRGHGVTVLCTGEGSLWRRCRDEGVPHLPIDLRRGVVRPGILGLARALGHARADVVIGCSLRATRAAVLALRLPAPGLAARRPPPPFIYNIGTQHSFKNGIVNRLVVAPLVTRFVVCAEAVRQELLAFGWVSPQRLRLIYNGVVSPGGDERDTAALRAALGARPEEVVILVLARLDQDKGHATLLRTLGTMTGSLSRVNVWFAGDGVEAANLRAQVRALRLEQHVRLLGFWSDVSDLLRAADVLCHPSRREGGAPYAIQEAMAAGLPVVAVAAGGTPELVIHGCTGLLSSVGDEASLRCHLNAMIAAPELRRRFGEAGRQRVLAEFSEERSMDRWMDLLEEVVAES